MPVNNSDETADSRQFLTFTLGEEIFAIEIGSIREVTEYAEITRVPRMPVYLKGVMNLRGNVVSVIDLRLKLGMSHSERTIDTCIIIAEIHSDGECLPVGILADSVQEVIHLPSQQIEAAPKVGIKLNSEFIKAVGKRENEFIIILNIERILAQNEPEVQADTETA